MRSREYTMRAEWAKTIRRATEDLTAFLPPPPQGQIGHCPMRTGQSVFSSDL